jgi:hypothetical protein
MSLVPWWSRGDSEAGSGDVRFAWEMFTASQIRSTKTARFGYVVRVEPAVACWQVT